MKKIIYACFIFFAIASAVSGQIYERSDSLIFNEKITLARKTNLFDEPAKTVFLEIAKSFVGTQYKAHSIETKGKEKLKICFTGLDCYTFVETSLAFSRIICRKDTTFEALLNEIKNVRYRNGKLNGYVSRLHYFTDWIYDLEQRKIIRNVTKKIGGEPYDKKINFMSSHPGAYSQLNENPSFIDSIKNIEEKISRRKLYYIPQEKIASMEDKIESGDIIAITTNISGLDVSHVGIAIRLNDNRVHLLHAPNVGRKVQISEKPLAEYVNAHKIQNGIIVARVRNCAQNSIIKEK